MFRLAPFRPVSSLSGRCVRYNSSASTTTNSSIPKPKNITSPTQHVLTLRRLDQLVTSISKSSTQTVSLSAMRSLKSPWLSSKSPDLTSGSPSKEHDQPSLSKEELEELSRPRHMSESFTTFELPLASDPALREKYLNASGGIRMGKLLEHLDSLAGAVSYRHCLPALDPTSPDPSLAFYQASSKAGLYLATASADRLDLFGRLNRDNIRDLRFSGFITWTGNSSMEVVVKMEGTCPPETDLDGWETLLLGRFAMVCRDSKTQKARKIPELILETEEEKALWRFGEEHKKRQSESKMMALDKVPPSSEEAKELHDLMLRVQDEKLTELNGDKVVQIRDTEMETVQLMFPQDRNIHGKVFGGILMRSAFELAFTNAAIFAGRSMRFVSLDQITFRLPVPVGAVLRLSSKIVHTTRSQDSPGGETKVHLMVRAEVEEIETGSRRETNTFFFTMATEDGQPLGKTVIPYSYSEAMHYLEGKRRLAVGDEMRSLYKGGIQ